MPTTLVVLAAGAARRFGRLKQLAPLGPGGRALLDFALLDASRAGFDDAVLVIRPELEDRFEDHFQVHGSPLPVRYAHQTLALGSFDQSGRSAQTPALGPRERPWGTGQAVLAARPLLPGPFAVVNADDFYGAGAYRAVYDHLSRSQDHTLVLYPVDRTLSDEGGVSRALCRVDAEGALAELVELTDVRRRPDGTITGQARAGTLVRLRGDEPISMNLWGFAPSILPALQARFEGFLEEHRADRDAEFLLPEAVAAEIAEGRCRVMTLRTEAESFGVTFPGDADRVRERLAALCASGQYPRAVATTDRRTQGSESADSAERPLNP